MRGIQHVALRRPEIMKIGGESSASGPRLRCSGNGLVGKQRNLGRLRYIFRGAIMKTARKRLIFSIVAAICLWAAPATVAQNDKAPATKPPRDYPVKPVPFTAVHFNDVFWAPRIEINRTVTIPFAFEKCEETKRVYHFERAAAALRGERLQDKKPPGYPFDDTDVYKVLEGASYALSVHPDPKLESYLDIL